jgi:hypothetical protein
MHCEQSRTDALTWKIQTEPPVGETMVNDNEAVTRIYLPSDNVVTPVGHDVGDPTPICEILYCHCVTEVLGGVGIEMKEHVHTSIAICASWTNDTRRH